MHDVRTISHTISHWKSKLFKSGESTLLEYNFTPSPLTWIEIGFPRTIQAASRCKSSLYSVVSRIIFRCVWNLISNVNLTNFKLYTIITTIYPDLCWKTMVNTKIYSSTILLPKNAEISLIWVLFDRELGVKRYY